MTNSNGFYRDFLPVTEYQETPDGYLVVTADRVARTGIQEYFGFENDNLAEVAKMLGKSNRDPIRVYRSPEEVFSDSAVNSWAHKPVTVMHPDRLVTPSNYTDYAVGEVSTEATISSDKKWFGLKMIVKKQSEIDAIKDGKYPETSAGYTANIVIDSGVTPDGEQYDAIQTNITPNHMAFVPMGRAFSDRKVSAEKWGAAPQITKPKEESKMDLIKVMVGDKAVQVAADDANQLTQTIADHKTAIDEKDEAIGNLKAKLADAESKVLSDEDLDAKVKALADAKANRDKAKELWGDDAVEGASDAEITGMLKVADQAKPADDKMRKALGDAKTNEADPWDGIIKKKDAK